MLFLIACSGNGGTGAINRARTIAGNDSIFYAQGFQIETHTNYTLVTVRNPWQPERILQRFVLVLKTSDLPENLPEGTLIRTPLQRTVSYGSVQCSFFSEFGALSTLVGVCEPQYINIPFVQDGVRNGNITDLGQADNPDWEKLLLIEPEALFSSPLEETGFRQTDKYDIPNIKCIDYMESSPLGRAEWIRFFALFFEQRTLADSLFQETVEAYNHLKSLVAGTQQRPTILMETPYNGVWYVSGGNSYMANIFRDAGGDYLWKDDTNTGSIGLSFEAVLEKAEKADFWLIKYNSPRQLTYRELEADNPNYIHFDAFKKKNIYVCHTGETPYYEELPIHPDFILKDMIGIFHPELLPAGYRQRYFERLSPPTH
ncbi:iron ABC transporter substrate-binding protein [Bacteroidia bacterium]|nr:iron ABC transporter substrate-binding protein [Bacteroidia bacterium]